jgi:hypothetical protein
MLHEKILKSLNQEQCDVARLSRSIQNRLDAYLLICHQRVRIKVCKA